MKTFIFIVCLLSASAGLNAQTTPQAENKKSSSKSIAKSEVKDNVAARNAAVNSNAAELAKAALNAHGGEKLRKMKTLTLRGSVDVTGQSFAQPLAGSFAIIFSGDKYRLQIQSPFVNFTQTFNGEQTYSSMGNVQLPPLNRMGLPLLSKFNNQGFTVSELADKKKRGFRVSSPEGFTTDFIVDEKTGQVKSYSSVYNMHGREVTTAVEHDKFRTVEGLLLPERYSQRFDIGQNTFYAAFKIKEILVNTEIADDVFTLQ